MKKLYIKYPDGSIHYVSIINVKRVVNKITGEEEIIMEYIDHSDGNMVCYTPIINVSGKWYKNPKHDDYGDYIFFDKIEDKIINELPSEIESLEVDKAKKEYERYCREIIRKIINMIGLKFPYLVNDKNSYVMSLLDRLENVLLGKLSFGQIDNILERIASNLSTYGSLVRELSTIVKELESYEVIQIRSNSISLIIRQLGLMEIATPGVDFGAVILKLRSIKFLKSDFCDELIKEINFLLEHVKSWDVSTLNRLRTNILSIIFKYEELFKDSQFNKVATAVKFPPEPKYQNTEDLFYKYKEKYLLKKPSSLTIYRKHYVAIPSLDIFGKDKFMSHFQIFMNVSPSVNSITYNSGAATSMEHRDIIRNYLSYLGDKFRKEGVTSLEPLYFKNHTETQNDVFDVYYFGICDTKEKFIDVVRATDICVYIPDEYSSVVAADSVKAFEKAMEGEYSMQVLYGKYYEGRQDNRKISRNGKR